jgi:hypothetical protein
VRSQFGLTRFGPKKPRFFVGFGDTVWDERLPGGGGSQPRTDLPRQQGNLQRIPLFRGLYGRSLELESQESWRFCLQIPVGANRDFNLLDLRICFGW